MLIGVTKDGVRFSTQGDIGSANVTLRCIPSSDDSCNPSYNHPASSRSPALGTCA